MGFVGYYPGIDFTDSSQFGRVVHTQNFIESYESLFDDGTFIVGRKGNFDNDRVREIGFGVSLFSKLLRDVKGLLILIHFYLFSGEEVILYCRDSPYISKLIMSWLPNICTVIEINGVPEDEEGRQGGMKKQVYSYLRRANRRSADLLVAVSSGIKEQVNDDHADTEIVVVENGVDVELFRPKDPGESATDGNVICYVGGLQNWQGITRMLNVVTRLDEPVQFLVVGGTDEARQELREQVSERGIEDRVRLVGRVDHSEVPDHIRKSNVCFGPFASQRQASPMKVYEYLSCGKPVVILNDVGLEYMDEYPGVYRLPTDTEDDDIAAIIEDLFSKGEQNLEGRRHVVEDHSWDSTVERVHEAAIRACSRSTF